MKHIIKAVVSCFAICLAMSLVTLGCSSSSDNITIADFAGSWSAASYLITSKADPTMTLDPIALGATMTTIVDVNGRFSGTATLPAAVAGAAATIPLAGVFVLVDQQTLTIDFQPPVPPFFTDETMVFDLSGNTLTLSSDNSTFDWDGDGTEEPSTVRVEMRRM